MGQITLHLEHALRRHNDHAHTETKLDAIAQHLGLTVGDFDAPENLTLGQLAHLCDHLGTTPGELLRYTPSDTHEGETEVESRDIVERWERRYGDDERPRN